MNFTKMDLRKNYINNDEKNRKKIRYRVKDNLVDFYFRYVFLARSKQLRQEPTFYFEHFVRKDFLEKYVPHKFEDISKEFLLRMNFLGRINPVFFRIGEYYLDSQRLGINREFDVVTEDESGCISYKCKYKDSPVNALDVAEEAFQTSGLPDIQFYKLGFISKTGFVHDVRLEEIVHFTLEDFYS